MDNKKDNPSFLSLVPTSEANDIESYQEAIEWALNEDGINNIAITGGYGSGKSSILQSVVKNLTKKENFKNKIVEISLANFKNDTPIDKEEIEEKVLKQLFYQKSNKTLPHSRFTKISFLTNKQRKKLSVYLVMYLILLVIDLHVFLKGDITKLFSMLFQPYISEISKEKYLNIIAETLPRFFHLLFIILNLIVIQKIFYVLLGKISSINFKKVNITKNSINAEADFEKNILNNHLDELLYFFQATGHTIVIFEDLDRYNNAGIFTDLREINEVINKYESVGNVKFIYALKDSMFSQEERTKFFDFIIPILPYTTASNFVEKFENEYNQQSNSENFKPIDSELLKELSIYNLNMRQIKNIINETLIYYKALDTEIDINKLLVFIFYKNMYPDDYEQFQSDKGILATILNARGELTRLKSQEISNKINVYEKESKHIFTKNLEEIIYVTIMEILKSLRKEVYFVEGKDGIFKKIVDIDFEDLKYITNQQSINIGTQEGRQNSYYTDNNPISKNIIDDFNLRLRAINFKKDEDIKTLRSEMDSIQGGLFYNIISFDNMLMLLKEEKLIELAYEEVPEIVKNQLKFIYKFIKTGYLVENYSSYKNKFILGDLSKSDHDYLIKVMDWSYSRVDSIQNAYNILDPEEVIKLLPKRCFKTVAILNFSLVAFLLRDNSKFVEQKGDLINVLINESKETQLFIEDYLNYEYEGDRELITILWKKWDKLPYFIEQTSNEQLRTLLLKKIYLVLDNEDYIINHNSKVLIKYTEKNSHYLFKSKLDDSNFNSFVKKFDIKFESIQLENPLDEKEKHDFSKKINYLIENNFYQINYENLQVIVNQFGEGSGEKLPYYSIINQINQIDMKYIDSHINQYIDAVYTQDISVVEEEDVYIKLLNHLFSKEDELSDLVITFIDNLKKSNIKISNVKKIIDNSLKIELFSKEIMSISWENFILIFSFEKAKEALFDYLNKKEVCDTLIQLKAPNTTDNELIVAILESNDLSDAIYDKYIQVFSEQRWTNLDIKDLDYKKKQSLIHFNVLDYDYNYVKEINDKNLILEFVELNASDFIDDLDSYDTEFINENLDFFISNKTFNQKQKIILCKYLDSKGYTIGDLNIIKVEEFAEFLHGTLDEEQWNVEWIERLLMSTGVSDVTKIKLFNRCAQDMSVTSEFVKMFLKNMESKMFHATGDHGKFPKISKTDENEEFAKYLKRAGIISSYTIIPDKNLIKINNWKNIKN